MTISLDPNHLHVLFSDDKNGYGSNGGGGSDPVDNRYSSSSKSLDKGGGDDDPQGGSDYGEMAMNWARDAARNACTKKQLYKKFPILEWLPKYNGEKFVCDLIAGITVGLTVIPQGIAYALVAELPAQVSKIS